MKKYNLAKWTEFMPESEIRRLLRVNVPYYFGGGKPGVFGYQAFSDIFRSLATEFQNQVDVQDYKQMNDDLNYGVTGGMPGLRSVLADRLGQDNIQCTPDEVVISTGGQQALSGMVETITNPGDLIITARPTYLGFLQPAVKQGCDVITVDQDLDGMVVDDLEGLLGQLEVTGEIEKLKMVYVIADSDNPKGTTLPENRRKKLFELATRYDFLIFEDAAYRDMQFKPKLPTMKSMDKDNEFVVFTRTTSKEVASLRIGYSVMPEQIREAFIKLKGFWDLCTPTITQKIAELYYREHIDKYLPNILEVYKKRAELMGGIVDETFPTGKRTNPSGGMFIWYESEKPFDATKFLEDVAIPNDVLYVPGASFYPLRGRAFADGKITDNVVESNTMRLSFSFVNEEIIDTGMKKLGQILSENLG